MTDVNFSVNAGDRIALVGRNGAGKSTLLKILANQQQPTSGVVTMARDLTVGYLPQVMQPSDSHNLMEEASSVFSHIGQMEARIGQIQQQLATRNDHESDDYMRLVEQFTQLSERHAMLGGQHYQSEIERTLLGLGFRRTDFQRSTSEFSGGWRMRIELAKILLQKPCLLLLDEPTNHLDIGSIQWLEQFIHQHAGAVILVSHDRAFINNVTTRTLEITCGHLIDYKVSYDEYVLLREQRRATQLRAYENQQREIAEARDFIERFRYKPTKSNQVQSRIKMLEKIVPIEVDEIDTSHIHLRFPPCQRSGDYPVICDEVGKSFGQHRVFSHVNLTIRRGEKVAFVGNNGEGKSTLVKCIMQQHEHEGLLTIGHNVQIGYFAQNQAQLLDGSLTVYDTIDHVATGEMRTRIRDLLGAFMFGGEASDKYVRVLSGGERSRLAMIRLLLQPVNLLILDEPTNHLDMPSKDVLKQAIQQFDGTAIIVSHDRDFLDGLVTRVFAFADGQVREHLGSIYDYLEQRSRQAELTGLTGGVNHRTSSSASSATSGDAGPKQNRGAQDYTQRKEQQKQLRRAQRAVDEAEMLIARLEADIAQVEQQLATPVGASDTTLYTRHADLQHQLEKAMQQWEQASEELETMGQD